MFSKVQIEGGVGIERIEQLLVAEWGRISRSSQILQKLKSEIGPLRIKRGQAVSRWIRIGVGISQHVAHILLRLRQRMVVHRYGLRLLHVNIGHRHLPKMHPFSHYYSHAHWTSAQKTVFCTPNLKFHHKNTLVFAQTRY